MAQVAWAVSPGYSGKVRVSSRSLLDGQFGLLAITVFDTPSTTGVLDPQAANPVPMRPHWNEWISRLFLPGAGCYALDATWRGGGWSIPFAAGR